MVALQIRDVPEATRDALVAMARERGQSLQMFLLTLVEREARFANNLTLLDQIDTWEGGAEQDAPAASDLIDAARSERDLAHRGRPAHGGAT